jgi:hypothetical protein
MARLLIALLLTLLGGYFGGELVAPGIVTGGGAPKPSLVGRPARGP